MLSVPGSIMSLPTDDESLVELYARFADHGASAMFDKPLREADLVALDPDLVRQLQAEFEDPRRAFRGIVIDATRQAALPLLGADAERVKSIPVGLLPTHELNASAVRTPRGGAVILLNRSVMWALPLLFFSYAALDSWHTADALTKEMSDLALAECILSLAMFCATDDLRHLAANPDIAVILERIAGDKEVVMNAVLMECFVLLHEYGHILHGHLDTHDTMSFGSAREEPEVTCFRRRWDQRVRRRRVRDLAHAVHRRQHAAEHRRRHLERTAPEPLGLGGDRRSEPR
jgi:hypothetical protein